MAERTATGELRFALIERMTTRLVAARSLTQAALDLARSLGIDMDKGVAHKLGHAYDSMSDFLNEYDPHYGELPNSVDAAARLITSLADLQGDQLLRP